MTKRRKPVRPSTGRSALQNLQYLGYQVNHPLLINDFEAKEPRRRSQAPSVSDKEESHRFICFTGIPACVLSSKGSGTTRQLAEESAAHAMLDFFRVAVSPIFVNQLCACADDNAIQPLVGSVRDVFTQFDMAIASDFLSINRCTQLETTPAAQLRGREVKKRVLTNLRHPYVGYGESTTQRSTPQKQAVVVPAQARKQPNVEVVTLDDEDDDGEQPLVEVEDEDQSPSRDLIVMREKIIPKRKSFSPPRKASSAVESMRKGDQAQKAFYEKMKDETNEARRREEPVDSSSYFGELNTSQQGPSDVFCCVPNTNAHHFEEASSSEDEQESSDGEKACPSKKAKMGDSGDQVVVLNTTTSAGSSSNQMANGESAAKRSKNSEVEEIGDIVDEWEDNDSQNSVKSTTPQNVPGPSSSSTSKAVDPLDGFYAGHPNHRTMIVALGLPVNYQARTLGVVINEQMVLEVEKFVEKVSEKSTDSVKKMSQQAWDHYQYNSQPPYVLDRKLKARTMLFQEFQKLFPDKCVSLQITGSTINGCGSFNSDVDMCFCFPTNGYRGNVFDDFQSERSHASKVLRKLDKSIKRCKPGQPLRKYIKTCELVPAKVPIVKLVLQGEFPGMEVDINVNNIAGIYNSHLTHYYSLIDARFPTIALAIKHWASRRSVNNAQQGYLNSYTIILLVVHYLQCGVTPAVLPNLQYLFPEKFDKKLPISALQLYGDIADRLPVRCPNTWSTGELLIGFFYYYSHFDFTRNAISIRSAQVVPRSCLPQWTSNYQIFVEEPFDAVNTARSVRTSGHLAYIKQEFRRAKSIVEQKKFTMKDIGIIVADVPGRVP